VSKTASDDDDDDDDDDDLSRRLATPPTLQRVAVPISYINSSNFIFSVW